MSCRLRRLVVLLVVLVPLIIIANGSPDGSLEVAVRVQNMAMWMYCAGAWVAIAAFPLLQRDF